ncbi:Probable phosphoglycerate mutase GpmB [Listeria monocytogenes N53-1]|nr:Probable phosphoglycerate mutase GpmB [Listeria monocytogenes N53-1]
MAEGLRTIYFVRHGKTEWNMTGQMQGWGDSPLVAEGIDGAKAVGEVLMPFIQVQVNARKIPRLTFLATAKSKFNLWKN